ncbi:DUF5132 domain-containing protein [Methylobacterium nodulans]|uniref:DUF5132 domain-containing protein n=1 Tax=Methylobacterium nodulans (strain LMG 21967 / CNCM I-2342 / ORS 2060) TaxID=460265 RepID=B8IEI9_METNO|nr:DUF5132 domain-containing protein [Methylobacterium nodulans]ACL59561.1 hypothetical protein Mnod_4696 [Methylobacterium nodulans ORS 2060]
MSALEDAFKGGNVVTALVLGVGAVVIAPAVLPATRPVAKALIKAGLIAYDQARTALAELNEQAGDILAEARAEIAEHAPAPAPEAEKA